MNGITDIDATLNPCSAEMDRKTYGWPYLNVCFWGKRMIMFTVGRLTVDIFASRGRAFTCMGGGANGSERYWNLFWPLGSVMWITSKSNANPPDMRQTTQAEDAQRRRKKRRMKKQQIFIVMAQTYYEGSDSCRQPKA